MSFLSKVVPTIATLRTSFDLKKLLKAAYNGDTTTVNALLTEGFDVNRQRIDGVTALYIAAQQGQTEVV